MKCLEVLLFIFIFGGTWRYSRSTCVLESDFGFVINCAFKKSGLFRVRNLGGVKAHIGLGFTLGDELGFKESLSNVESNRRRSVQGGSRFQAAAAQAQQAKVGNPIMVKTPPNPASAPNSSAIPPFKPIPPAPERPSVPNGTKTNVASPAVIGVAVPASSSSISRLSAGPTVAVDTTNSKVMGVVVPVTKTKPSDKLSSTNFSIRTLPTPNNNELPPPIPQTASNSIQTLLASGNLTEALEALLLQRQKQQATTYKPSGLAHKNSGSLGKVMNAPKEYYPVGYDKNFDDNFASRVELPDTSFYCGDQKHFPGLYADEDLGCMVFHVCALTDDGLIMKSFLCPESTLFDQTILKCNWWFYVDCKNSKKLYDSNIPVSKSYQLMKALTFFSSYKKDAKEKD